MIFFRVEFEIVRVLERAALLILSFRGEFDFEMVAELAVFLSIVSHLSRACHWVGGRIGCAPVI